MDIFIVKENLINNLCTGLIPHILDGFMSIYEDALRVNPKNTYEQNKRFLLEIKNWPPRIIATETKRIVAQFKMLRKVIKTINFINIKSLALIGKNNISVDDIYISKNTPQVDVFIHNIYTNSSKEFFHDEQLMNFGISGTRARQASVIESVIKRLLNEAVPIHDLLYNIVDDTDESLTLTIQQVAKTVDPKSNKAPVLLPPVKEHETENDDHSDNSDNNSADNVDNVNTIKEYIEDELDEQNDQSQNQIEKEDEKENDENDENEDQYVSTMVSRADTENIIIENTKNNKSYNLKEDTLDMLQNTLVNMSSVSNDDYNDFSNVIANNKNLQNLVNSDVMPRSSNQTTEKQDKNSSTNKSKSNMRSLRNQSKSLTKFR